MSAQVLVGTFTIHEPTTYRTHYECAAWFKDVLVDPGTYPVYAYPCAHERSLGSTLYIECEGVVTGASFQALWAGNPIPGTKDSGPSEVGKREKASASIPTYAMHEHVVSGDLVLDPDLVYAQEYEGKHSVWDEGAMRFREEPCTRTFYKYGKRAA